jgi:hypothetical protein
MTQIARAIRATAAFAAIVFGVLAAGGCSTVLGIGDWTDLVDASTLSASPDGGTEASTSSASPDGGTEASTSSASPDGGTEASTSSASPDGASPQDSSADRTQGANEGGDAQPTCGAASCADGCCNSNGKCIGYASQTSVACGSEGLACGACVGGAPCSQGQCTCGNSSCDGCCSASATCVSPTTNQECGAHGAACESCSADQECSAAGQCACDAKTCPDGCCDSGGHCVTTKTNSTCGMSGVACIECSSGEECSSQGKCICDATSCPAGCCAGDGTCESYASQSATSCGQSGAACAPCTNGLCDPTTGKCACDAKTCAHGCCAASGACEAYSQQTSSSCGSAGAACGRCANGLCDTTSGACSCDENTCPHGCCTSGATCEAYAQEALSSCGTAGAQCANCGVNQATACTNGGCVCGNSAGCSGSSVCCGSACANLETDSNNCGSCGHGCLGGACQGGFCQPFSVGPVPSPGTGQGLTIDTNNVYYATFQGSLYSCPKTGCTTPTTLATGFSNPSALLYDSISHYIFVADTYNNAVEAYTTGGALAFTVTPMSFGVSGPLAFTSDANYIYAGVANGIVRFTRDGQTQVQIAGYFVDSVETVALDPDSATIYGGTITETGFMLSAPIDSTGTWSYFAGTDKTAQYNVSQIAIQNGKVYWINRGNYNDNGAGGGIFVCPTTGCSSPTVVAGTTPLTWGECIFADATYMYYVSDNNFNRCPLGGCPSGPTVLVSSGVTPVSGSSCAVDATSFYVLTSTEVLRIAK